MGLKTFIRNSYRVVRTVLFSMILIVAALYILLYVAISLPWVQDRIRVTAERELTALLGTHVSIGKVQISPAGELRLSDVAVPSPDGKPCLAVQRLGAGIDFTDLIINRHITITYGEIVGLDGHLIQKEKDGPWNIQFLIDAFRPKDPHKPPTKFDLTLHNVVIRKSAVAVDKEWAPRQNGRLDPNHLRIENLRADVTLPRLANDDFTIDLRRLSVSERSGLDLETLSAKVHLTPSRLSVDNLVVALPSTRIEIPRFELEYDGYGEIVNSLKSKTYALAFDNLRVTPYDLRALYPPLADWQSPLIVNLHAKGRIEDIRLEQLSVKGEGYGIELGVAGRVRNVTTPASIDLNVDGITARLSAGAIAKVLALVPKLADKPRSIISALGDVTLDASGTMAKKNATIEARVATAVGAVEAAGMADWSQPGVTALNGHVTTTGVELGKLLADARLGTIVADVTGDVELSKGDVNGHVEVEMPSFSYNGQAISNLVADVTKNGKDVNGNIAVESAPLSLSAQGAAVIDGKASVIEATVDLQHFDAAGLGVKGIPAGYTFSGHVDASVNGIDPATFTGSLAATDLHMDCPRGPLDVRSLTLTATTDELNYRHIELRSDYADAEITGTFDVAQLPKAATALAAQAMPALLPAHLTQADYTSQNVDFDITVHNNNTLTEYFNLPVRLLTDVTLRGSMHGPEGTADLNLNLPYLQQGKDKLIRNIYVNARLDGGNHSALLDVGALLPGKNDTDVTVGLNATGIDDVLRTRVMWDLNRQKAYRGDVECQVAFERDHLTGQKSFVAKVIPSTFAVADAIWNVGQGLVVFADGVLDVDNLSVWHGGQFVNINGRASKSLDDKITVDLSDIDLDYIFETLNINYVTFGGHATGKAVAAGVFDFKNMDAHTEGLHVDSLQYNGGLLGDAELSGTFDPQRMKVGIGADISEAGRHVATVDGGIWVTRDSLAFDMRTDRINVKFLQPFMQAFSSDIQGRASGHVNLFGTFSDIDMTGRVFADSLRMKVDYTNVYYTGSDSVIMTPGRIAIPNFKIYDRYGHSAMVTGVVNHRYFHDPTFEFKVRNADNLLCYNTNQRINPDWYGTIYGRGGGTISGRPGFVGIMVDMAIGPKSVFNFVLNDAEAVADYQFLEFTDRHTAAAEEEKIRLQAAAADTIPDFVKAFRHRSQEQRKQEEAPSVFALDIRASVNPDAEMVLVMDPVGGDRIRAHGSGALQIGYSTDSDEMTMYGKYTLADGMYNFTLQDLIIKDFTIRPGSIISFNGDPLKALLDINASYRVNTSLTDLDKSFASDRDLNRTNVPVDAVLSVRGDLEQPDISFDIELPTLTSDVARKVKSIISTDDMMSRQIIYLLALNRFYTPEYMGSTSNGGEWASVASATVTSQLTNMLSQLTDKFTVAPSLRSDKGDFSDMEVDVALSSRLLNNRLLINGNLGYRDPSTSNTTFIGDFDIEYLLNRSGALRLKAYNHFNDQNYYLKSALTTQGIGVVYRKEFDNMFKFLRRKKKDNDTIPTDK